MQQRSRYIPTKVLLIVLAACLVFVFVLRCHTQKQIASPPDTAPGIPFSPSFDLPRLSSTAGLIQHFAYTLQYNQQYKQPMWVAYLQTGAHSRKATEVREDNFIKDPSANFTTATEDDYRNTGFDRGHMAPAEDMAWTKKTMEESFYFTNTSPQKPAFNRGVWSRLEALLRYWSEAYDSIYIVTGPVLTPGLTTIGVHRVAVPTLFYKVVVEYRKKEKKGIGFLLPNSASAAPLQSFAVSVDSVERLTGLNFFPSLPSAQERKIEGSLHIDQWVWRRGNN